MSISRDREGELILSLEYAATLISYEAALTLILNDFKIF